VADQSVDEQHADDHDGHVGHQDARDLLQPVVKVRGDGILLDAEGDMAEIGVMAGLDDHADARS